MRRCTLHQIFYTAGGVERISLARCAIPGPHVVPLIIHVGLACPSMMGRTPNSTFPSPLAAVGMNIV